MQKFDLFLVYFFKFPVWFRTADYSWLPVNSERTLNASFYDAFSRSLKWCVFITWLAYYRALIGSHVLAVDCRISLNECGNL